MGRDEHALRERLGIQLQETQLAEKLTVDETVRLFRSFYPRGRSIDEVIDLVLHGEKRNARVGKLRGGQKQRLALACAMVGDPELIFLDEPTTGLDPQSRRQLWDLIIELRASGRSIVLTTHYMDEAERLCDRVAIVDHGACRSARRGRDRSRRQHVVGSLSGVRRTSPRISGARWLQSARLRGEWSLSDRAGRAVQRCCAAGATWCRSSS